MAAAGELDGLIEQLPQAPPARYVDRLVARDVGQRVHGQVTFGPGHRVFEGHLPDRPLVPGVVLVEALAQLAGLALVPAGGGRVTGVLAGVERVRFVRLIEPGETIDLEARLVTRLGSAARFDVEARVAGQPAATGQLTLGGMTDD